MLQWYWHLSLQFSCYTKTYLNLHLLPNTYAVVIKARVVGNSKSNTNCTIKPSSDTFKVLHTSILVMPQFIKQLHGPCTLKRAYTQHEKACINKQEVKKFKKVAKAEEQAVKATKLAATQGGTHGLGRYSRCSDGRVQALRALYQRKFHAEKVKID